MPEMIRNLLSRPWANYLVLVLLRQGDESDEWRHALRFADELVWSVQPKQNGAERERLTAVLPQLEKTLRHGLATVAFDETDVRRLMQQLNVLYQSLLQPAAATAVTEAPELELTDATASCQPGSRRYDHERDRRGRPGSCAAGFGGGALDCRGT